MKYSDSVKAILLAAIDELAANPEKYANRPGKDFTRNRKLGFKQLLLMFLTMYKMSRLNVQKILYKNVHY